MPLPLHEIQLLAYIRLSELPELVRSASRDADLLILHALGLDRTALIAHRDQPVTHAESLRIDALLDRRMRLEPIQYILGEQEFYGLPFRVTPATLIPRPETELLVEAVLGIARATPTATILDIGTGSGAIAVALAKHLPEARILAIDLSEAALEVARENATRNEVTVEFRTSDLLAAVPESFDIIVSNPPYIPDPDRPTLHPEVRDFEPATALFAGPDGLEVYRRLIPQAREHLNPSGLLAMEFGFGQAGALGELMQEWNEVEVLRDLQGHERVILGRRPNKR